MRVVIQRVAYAKVEVDGTVVSEIGTGFLILLGAGRDDDEALCLRMVEKISGLRVFPDDDGRMNWSLVDVGGQALVVSQFTLYANCKKGRRPHFGEALEPQEASRLCAFFEKALGQKGIKTASGVFGADMKVSLLNDGPVTICLDSAELFRDR